MPVERIDTDAAGWLEDPRLADYVAVRDPALVRRSGRFLAEGRVVVRTLLTGSPMKTCSVLVEEQVLGWLERHGPLDVPVYVVPRGGLRALSGFRFHQGCLAVGERPASSTAAEALAAGGPAPLVVALDEVSNPDNVGAIFRTAGAFGVQAVILSPGCASPLYRKAIRTSMGASLWLPFAHGEGWDRSLATLHDAGYALLALTPAHDAMGLEEAVAGLAEGEPRALLLGAEGPGLGETSLQAAGRHVRIPLDAGVDSLNVAAAAAVALYRLRP